MEKIRLVVFLICVNGIILSDGFCRRRRSPPSWGSWLSWGGCNKACGPHGTMSRFRQNVCSSSTQQDVAVCNRFCYNGVQIIANTCQCPGHLYGECCSSACIAINNCVDIQCTTSQDQYCLKCEYDRGEGRRAFELVEVNGINNRICEKRCSWRPDSQFCYPGICTGEPSLTCVCANGFTGDNCLQIYEPATVDSCTVTLQRPGYVPREVTCYERDVVYCKLKAEHFTVNVTVSFTPDLPPQPYYVNVTVFGIIEATIEWTLITSGTGSTHTDEYNCFVAESAIDAQVPSQLCINEFDISSYDVRDGDELTISSRSKNSGYIKINNYDDENSVTVGPPIPYSTHDTVNETKIIFDFTKPVHCISTEMPCFNEVMDIGSHYIRNNRVTVTWIHNDWSDITSGIDHYNCEAFRLIVNSNSDNDELDVTSSTAHASKYVLPSSASQAILALPEEGIYSILLSVFDGAGNSERVRKYLTYDASSSVKIDSSKPITAEGASFNDGVVWLPVVTNKVTLKWAGHFFNAFHRDNKMLNAIKDTDPPMIPAFDDVTGQPNASRSREAIPNVDGIVRFKFDYAGPDSGKTAPTQWIEVDAPLAEKDISISVSSGQKIAVWMKAYDVMGNEQEDKAYIYVDETPPDAEFKMVDSDGNDMSMDGTIMDFDNNQIMVQVSDEESGIHKITWEIRDAETGTIIYAEGEVTEKPSDGNCPTSECECLDMADICYYSVYIINTESATMMEMPDGDVECVMKIIVYNNAMIETPMEMTLMARAPGARVGGSGGGSAGAAAGGVIVVIIIILIIVAVIILWRKNMLPKFFNRGPPITRASDWGASAQNLGNVNYQYDHGEEGEVKAAKGQLPPHTTNDYSVMPTIKPKFDAGAALTVEEMEFPSSRIQLRELLHSGVYKANASSISGIPGTSSVLVKTLKDPNNRSQREMLLHELDIMLTIIPHDNVIRLLGCITTRGTPKPSIIMEFAQYDNLSQVLRRSRQSNPDRPDDVYGNLFEGSDTLTSQKLLLFSEQVASGMEHVSSLGIIHRKLGARNVFVGNNEICKIGSFSKAIQTDKREVKDKQETRLPIRWMAPESLSNHIFSFKTDVWSFGILLWEIVTLGALPYPGMKNKEITEKVAKGYRMEKPPHCTQELFTVMLRSWNKNIERRPGFGELVQEIRYINRQEEVVNLNQYDSELYGDINDM